MCGPHRRFAPLLAPFVAYRKRQVLLQLYLVKFRKQVQKSFNTASGKHCYFITFVFPSLRSGTRDVRTSSSLRSSAASHPSSYTASGKHCCNYNQYTNKISLIVFQYRKWQVLLQHGKRPWTQILFVAKVSILQAVSTITLSPLFSLPFGQGLEMCGSHRHFVPLQSRTLRRIPQAVGAVATLPTTKRCYRNCTVSIPQAVSAVATSWHKSSLHKQKRRNVSIP